MGDIIRTNNLPELFQVTNLSIVSSQRTLLAEIDDELAEIRNQRKILRAKYTTLLIKRESLINSMPESIRPKRGRPKKYY